MNPKKMGLRVAVPLLLALAGCARYDGVGAVPLRPEVRVGNPAPDFTLADPAGGPVHHLAAAVASGPVVLVFNRGLW
jgi:hypothetical protein